MCLSTAELSLWCDNQFPHAVEGQIDQACQTQLNGPSEQEQPHALCMYREQEIICNLQRNVGDNKPTDSVETTDVHPGKA